MGQREVQGLAKVTYGKSVLGPETGWDSRTCGDALHTAEFQAGFCLKL